MLALLKLVPVHTWILLGAIVTLVTYHFSEIEATKLRTRAADQAEFAQQLAQVEAQAKAAQDAVQAKLDATAQQRNDAVETKITAIQQKLSTAPKPSGASVPVSCKADPARVAWADSTR